jgi:membrane-bound lytic murein transglycosylase D
LIAQSTEIFYAGKQAALSGDFDCAEGLFQRALAIVLPPGDNLPAAPPVQEFSASLYDSILRYESLARSLSEPDAAETRETPDELVGVPGAVNPEEIARAREEVRSDERATSFDIPITINDSVLTVVASFCSRESVRERFADGLIRAGRYLPMIRSTFKREGLPEDLAYVAMIESSFKVRARSKARAQGVWQFIVPTGRRYGLKKTRVLDERSDPVKATEAAAGYFKDLYEIFNDWYLVMAAYDAGEGRVARAIARTGSDNYWDLCRAGALPRETRLYVPSVIAAALIAKNQEHYGFRVEPQPPMSFETVTLEKPVSLKKLAAASGVDYGALAELNPELRIGVTPATRDGYILRVPKGSTEAIGRRVGSLPAAAVPNLVQHRVRKGETLARLARRYGISLVSLAEANDLNPRAKLAPRKLLVIPEPERAAYARHRAKKPSKKIAERPAPSLDSSSGTR